MRRSIERWRKMVPARVVEGSQVQNMHCIADAQADIIELYDENESLRRKIESLEGQLKSNKRHGFDDDTIAEAIAVFNSPSES